MAHRSLAKAAGRRRGRDACVLKTSTPRFAPAFAKATAWQAAKRLQPRRLSWVERSMFSALLTTRDAT